MPGAAARRKKAATKRPRPRFFHPSDETRRIAAMLGAELESFPDVSIKPMFGLVGYYRDRLIFAALPRTKALGSANSIIFKLNAAPDRVLDRARKDPRIVVSENGMKGWQSLEITSDAHIAAAQRWLTEAWRYAVKVKSKE
jgi:hypothetical protein